MDRRWGRSEVEEWVGGGSPRVRYASHDARAEPFRLGPDVTFHTGADAAAYIEANPSDWYETVLEDQNASRLVMEWILKTEGTPRKKYFEGIVRHYQSRGRVLLTEAALRYFDPYRPIPLGPETAPFDPSKPTEAANRVARFLVDASGDAQKDWRQRALLALEFALEETSSQGGVAATALLDRARSTLGQTASKSWTGESIFVEATRTKKSEADFIMFRLTSALSEEVGREQVSRRAEAAMKVNSAEPRRVVGAALESLGSSANPLSVYTETVQILTQLSDKAAERLSAIQTNHSSAVVQSESASFSERGSVHSGASLLSGGVSALYFIIATSASYSACTSSSFVGMPDLAGIGLFILAGGIALVSMNVLAAPFRALNRLRHCAEGIAASQRYAKTVCNPPTRADLSRYCCERVFSNPCPLSSGAS